MASQTSCMWWLLNAPRKSSIIKLTKYPVSPRKGFPKPGTIKISIFTDWKEINDDWHQRQRSKRRAPGGSRAVCLRTNFQPQGPKHKTSLQYTSVFKFTATPRYARPGEILELPSFWPPKALDSHRAPKKIN